MEKPEVFKEDYDWRIKIKSITPKEIRKLIKNSIKIGLRRDKKEERKTAKLFSKHRKISHLIFKLGNIRDKSVILKNKDEVFQFSYSAKNKCLGGSWMSKKMNGKEFLDKVLY